MRPIYLKSTSIIVLFLLLSTDIFGQGYSGLIARWSFNGNANDVSGNGLHGIVRGATLTAGFTGAPNTAYQFNGSSDYINVPYNALMNSMVHSICVMVKPTGFYSGTCQGNYILCRGPENTGGFYGLEYHDNPYDGSCTVYSPTYDVFSGGTGSTITADPTSAWYVPPAVVPNNWYCVVLTYDGSATTLYVNGVLRTVYHNTCSYSATTDSLTIGKSEFGPGYPYWVNGVIDEIRLYNRVLSPTEVTMFCDSVGATTPPSHTCNSILMPGTIHVCKDSTAQIAASMSGTDSILSISWTPATGLSGSSILNPFVTPPVTSGWRYLTVRSLNLTNLISNGNFSAGNVGFTSAYPYVSGPMSLWPPSVYTISTDPHNEHPTAYSYFDHTTGSGKMMAINGASTPVSVWSQAVSVTPNTDYVFSAWFSNWSDDTVANLPIIRFRINGLPLGAGPFTFVPTPGRWTKFTANWNSGPGTSASIDIQDLQTAVVGNDFTIDDISLQEVCVAKDSIYIDASISGFTHHRHDTSVCSLAGPATIFGPLGYSTYSWSTGSSASSINVTTSGSYVLTATSTCGLLQDTFNVSIVVPDTFRTHRDTIVCARAGGVLLSAPSGFTSYLWNTGGTSNAISVSSGGTYWVSYTRGCSVMTDTIHLTIIPLPVVKIQNDTAICAGDQINLHSVEPVGVSYLWNTGSHDSSIVASEGGKYKLTVTISGCSASDSALITLMNKPSAFRLGSDTALCNGEILTLQAPSPAAIWNDEWKGQKFTIKEGGIYWATISNNCGSYSDTIKVNYDLCDIWFPTGFTPNGDGLNDIIRVVGNLKHFTDFSFSVFNRWGQRVYFTQDIYSGWNGVFNSTPQDMGTYFYMIFYNLRGQKHMMKGDFQLIR